MFVPVFIIAATSHTEQSIQSPKTTITMNSVALLPAAPLIMSAIGHLS
ncbi:hypothetical protein CbuG_0155 [Coxiella burnetii CbuG_Q212]|nr:hypothetical protein CbuG_0155 [Coxiella burnetii CbuG_Q212]